MASNLKWTAFITVLVLVVGCVGVAEAQQAGRVRRIGYLAAAPGRSLMFEAFQQGLRDLGYVEGQNITIDYRSSEDRSQLSALASDLVQLKVDLIVTQGPASRTVKPVAATTPIVFGFSGDPIAAGLVDSLARPGRNMTGMSFLSVDLAGKRLELLKEAALKVSRVAIVSNPTHPGEQSELQETQAAARALKIGLQYLSVTTTNEFEKAFDAMVQERAQAILTFPDALTLAHRVQLVEFALKRRLPTVFGWSQYVEAGGLMSYGPNLNDSFRHLAIFVDKIFKGTKPADLPVEQPTKFELVINLKTAKQIGLTIPPNVLARADKVIR